MKSWKNSTTTGSSSKIYYSMALIAAVLAALPAAHSRVPQSVSLGGAVMDAQPILWRLGSPSDQSSGSTDHQTMQADNDESVWDENRSTELLQQSDDQRELTLPSKRAIKEFACGRLIHTQVTLVCGALNRHICSPTLDHRSGKRSDPMTLLKRSNGIVEE